MQHEKDSFSFKKAIREACRDFPLETRQVTFVEASTPDAHTKFTQTLKRMSKQTQKHVLTHTGSLNTAFELVRIIKGDSVLSDDVSGRKILFVDPTEKSRGYLFHAQFAFDHELGHIVTRNGLAPMPLLEQTMAENPNQCLSILARMECAADTFAALRGLQRGSVTIADIEQLSLDRALSTLNMGFIHITTLALDALLVHPDIKTLVQLSPQAMASFAADHAEKHAPSAHDIQTILLYFGMEFDEQQPHPKDKRSNLDRTAANLVGRIAPMCSAGDNGCTTAFHIAARVMRHVFDTNGLHYPDQIDHKFDSKYWQFIEKRLSENAKEMGRLRPLLTPKKRGFAA